MRASGQRINGGFYDGQPCGRDTGLDFIRDGITYHAVTVA